MIGKTTKDWVTNDYIKEIMKVRPIEFKVNNGKYIEKAWA